MAEMLKISKSGCCLLDIQKLHNIFIIAPVGQRFKKSFKTKSNKKSLKTKSSKERRNHSKLTRTKRKEIIQNRTQQRRKKSPHRLSICSSLYTWDQLFVCNGISLHDQMIVMLGLPADGQVVL